MTLKQKLKALSKIMRIVGNNDPSHKGLAMHSMMSPEMQKSTLLYFRNKFFTAELSVIFLDLDNHKIVWHNQIQFLETGRAIIYVKDNYYMCVRRVDQQNVALLSTFLHKDKELSLCILDFLEEFNIFYSDITYDVLTPQQSASPKKNNTLCMALLNYSYPGDKYATITQAEKLRLLVGDQIYNDIDQDKKTISDISAEFEEYLNTLEKIVYVMT
jgi:hypothetical protein